MRILWLHQYFATPAGWGSVRTYEFGRRFVAAGHAVDVLCCAAYDPSLAGRGVVEIAGMRVHVSRTRYRPQMGFLARVGSFLSFACFAMGHVLRWGRKYDLIIASSSPLTMAIPALLARWIHGTPFVFEVIDVWPDAAIEAGVLRNPLLRWLAFRLEASAYRHASRIVTCSPGMTERIVRKGGDRATGWRSHKYKHAHELWERHPVARGDKISTISNSCDLDVFRPDPVRRAAVRAALGVRDEQFVVLYTGALGRSNAVDDLVQAAEQLAGDARFVWWFAGDGAEAGKLRQVAAGRVFGPLPRERVVELCQAADAALVTFLHAPLFYENSPNKFFDAIAAGLPVIFNRSTWLEKDIAQYECGFVCNCNPMEGRAPASPSAREMAARLRQLADDPALRARMGAGARRLAEECFSRDKLAEKYIETLRAVLV
jgi:glycosyltransferase involved in cell wall biosynthesis